MVLNIMAILVLNKIVTRSTSASDHTVNLLATLLQLLNFKCFGNTLWLSYKIISQFGCNVKKGIEACQ